MTVTLNRINPPNNFLPRTGHYFAIETEDHGDVIETRTLDARTWGCAKAEARDLFASPRCSDTTLSVFMREWDGDDCMGEVTLRAGIDPDCNCDDCEPFVEEMGR